MWWVLIVLLVISRCGFSFFLDDAGDTLDFSNAIQKDYMKSDLLDGALKLHGNSSNILNPNNIYEWTPITNNLIAGGRDTFIFDIDTGTTGFGIASTYEILILLSGSICKQPANAQGSSLGVFYSFDETLFGNISVGNLQMFQNGYLQALALSPLESKDNNATSKYSNLYVVVTPVNETTGQPLDSQAAITDDPWEYKMSISENDLVYQWDSRSWLQVLDTDHNSALLLTGNVSAEADSHYNYSIYNPELYDLYVFSEEGSANIERNLNLSICAMMSGDYLVSSAISPGSESHPLERSNLAISKSITSRSGSVREQFYVTGLNASTTYVAYLTKKIGKKGNLSHDGGVLFSKETFRTQSSNNCSLIFDLEFCSGVAYSVPTSSNSFNKTLLATTFDKYAQSLFQNFSKALQIIPCEMELDARYSPLRTCEHCSSSYQDWLCAVTIPRCSVTRGEYHIHREKSANRNQFINDEIRPLSDYYEIPPCIEMCYYMVRDCPSDFGFACPNRDNYEDLFKRSYGYYDSSKSQITCNFIGNTTDLYLTASKE
ncbi:MID1 (YNL291C) [Zygosaccharomyces parabailii]|nr:MID1 (YNL291C) [Zygosaccharomyces parabailii]CDH12938.1 related to Stretch-activated cation channel MID1 [Zygosaccharomyces bailii ISA1307]